VRGLEEIRKIEEALLIVERYEAYLFKRALGIAFIVCGVAFPLTAFMVLNAEPLAELLNMSSGTFVTFVPTITLLVGMAAVIYSFTSAHVVTARMRKTPVRKDLTHMVVMFLVWFLAFYLTNYVPEPYTAVSWLWAGGVASLISYSVLKRENPSWVYPELLIVGVICLTVSVPLLLMGGSQLVEGLAFLTFGVSFIAGGFHSLINASRELSESDK
jgi:hypothetical protein